MADAMPLAAFLERAKLSKHLASLEEAGCADAADLAEAADDDLVECGLRKIELKRLRRTLTELGFGGSSSSLAAAVVAGAGAAVAAAPAAAAPLAPKVRALQLSGSKVRAEDSGSGKGPDVIILCARLTHSVSPHCEPHCKLPYYEPLRVL